MVEAGGITIDKINKCENLYEMDDFLEKNSLPQLTTEATENLSKAKKKYRKLLKRFSSHLHQ